MRPLRLQVENLASFRGRHEPLELSGFDLFVIAGPTGAGKSSLLDAIVFALYGRVPRLGRGVSEMIATGRDRLAVTLDFKSAGRTYRVVRALHRGRKGRASEAVLEEIVAGDERPIADGVAAVNKALEQVVGLGYDAFTQAVVLPQGEFQRFLKSEPASRRAILSDLLRLQVYKRMYDAAAAEAGRLQAFIQGQRAVLDADAQAATEDAIAETARRLDRLREANQSRRAQAATRETLLSGVRARIEAEARSRAALDEESRHADAARAAEAAALGSHETARQGLADAERAAAALPGLDERLRALDEVRGLLQPLESARRRARDAEQARAQAEAEARAGDAEAKSAGARVQRAAKALNAAVRRLESAGYDAARHERLESLREPAALLSQARVALAQAEAALADADAEASRASADERRAAQARQAADRAYRDAAAALEEAQQRQRHAEQQHAAAHLREALVEGAACPVCEQKVARRPARLRAPGLDAVRASLGEAREAERRAQATLAATVAAADQLERVRRSALESAQRAATQREAVAAQIADAEARLQAAAGDDLERRGKGAVEERVAQALQRLLAARRDHDAALAERVERERERDQAQSDADRSADKAAAARTRVAEHARLREESEREAHELEAKLIAVVPRGDPEAERARVLAERSRLAERQARAERAEREAAALVSDARSSLAASQRSRQAAERTWTADNQALVAARHAAGLPETGSAARCLADAETELLELKRALDLDTTEEGRLSQQLTELEQRAERVRERGLALQRDERRQALFQQLASDLRSENFRAFVLEEAFQELVAGAGARLLALSGRYGFEFQDDAFHVVDHDSAGERRSAETLSGGETFLASLSLALELSQQIQRAAGAVHLDSLFIDEGFGTLDPEALETIAGALEDLQVGGRMVGIITHLPDLTARIPNRVLVEKRQEGSRLTVERA